jgi:A/G-specific adenine glycosylase
VFKPVVCKSAASKSVARLSDSQFAAGDFSRRVIAWQRRYGRHHLPWQNVDDPYRIWLSEIMLQQTQVGAVVPYFQRFVERFPAVRDLARAAEDDVLALWSGLGYYARARNLHRAAKRIEQVHRGCFPDRFEDIVSLPGVGRSTAGAIAVFAFGQRYPILDGNVKRVLARCFGVEGYPGTASVAADLWALSERLLPETELKAYTQGMMDLGAQVCRRSHPACEQCPLATQCVARMRDRISEFPAPRPKKQRPRRSTVMLIMQCNGQIMMEKRPSPGIWGGLWSFPETDDVENAAKICVSRFGRKAEAVEPMVTIEHGFTHFSLTISALVCRVTQPGPEAEEPGRVWVTPEDAERYAIPVPVRKLIEALQASPTRKSEPQCS